MGETEVITVHEINILVTKRINKDSELSSIQGTQGMITAWIFATTIAGFLGFRTIFFHIPRSNILCMIFFCIIYMYNLMF